MDDFGATAVMLLHFLLTLHQINRAEHLECALGALRSVDGMLVQSFRFLKIANNMVPIESVEEHGHVAIVVLD